VNAFDRVRRIGLTLGGVEAATRYDGSPRLTLGGCFVAGLATHVSAEAGTLVVRMEPDQRRLLLEDAPDTYYVTPYYEPYPVVLARLSAIPDDALRDLLAMSKRLTVGKTRAHRRTSSKNRRLLPSRREP